MPSATDELFDFLRFPSVSTDPGRRDSVRACAEWLSAKFAAMGLLSSLRETPGHPVVVAATQRDPQKRTVLIYGHYDVQPEDPVELWTSPPFDPVVRSGRVFARGATDNKGQIFAHVVGVERTLADEGALPVNVVFVVEGEEEVGSDHLAPFLEAHREELAPDVVALSDTGMIAAGHPTLTYGLRGICAFEIRVTGAEIDLHSGTFGGAVANPLSALARIVASFHDPDGRIAVDGFYDKVRPLEPWERAMWAGLPFSDEGFLKLTGAPALCGEKGFSTLERLWARPTAEVNGIGGGFQGQGTKTVLPSAAFAKFTCRLVPDQHPEEIATLVRAHVAAHTPPGVRCEVEMGHGALPFLADPRTPAGKAAQRAMEKVFGGPPALIREGGSIPVVQTFHDLFGAPILLAGLADPDCRAHAPDENFPLANFENGIRLNRALLQELAE